MAALIYWLDCGFDSDVVAYRRYLLKIIRHEYPRSAADLACMSKRAKSDLFPTLAKFDALGLIEKLRDKGAFGVSRTHSPGKGKREAFESYPQGKKQG